MPSTRTHHNPARLAPLFAACVAAALLAVPVVAQETTLIEFEIEDQFKRKHTEAEFIGSVLVLVAGGRKGSEYTGAWQEAVIDALAAARPAASGSDEPVFLGYADTRGAPFFVKGMIRDSFPQDPDSPSLIDWKGTLAEAYQLNPDVATLLLFGRDGRLVTRMSGTTVEDAKVSGFVAMLAATLTSPDTR